MVKNGNNGYTMRANFKHSITGTVVSIFACSRVCFLYIFSFDDNRRREIRLQQALVPSPVFLTRTATIGQRAVQAYRLVSDNRCLPVFAT